MTHPRQPIVTSYINTPQRQRRMTQPRQPIVTSYINTSQRQRRMTQTRQPIALSRTVSPIIYQIRDFQGEGGGYVFFLNKYILIPNVTEKNILILVEEKK